MFEFIGGAITFGFLLAALLFVKFWRRTSDDLFGWFGLAFVMLALSHGLVALLDVTSEERSWLFLLRLAAFSIIVCAILRKNISQKTSSIDSRDG